GPVQRASRHLRHAVRTNRPGPDPFERPCGCFRGDVLHGCLPWTQDCACRARPWRGWRANASHSKRPHKRLRGTSCLAAPGACDRAVMFPVSVSPEHGLASRAPVIWEAAPMLAYTAPTTVEEAVRALAGASGVAKVLSGGTDLLVQ